MPNQPPRASVSFPPSRDDRLDSWKAIAIYLNREVRTVQRWEKSAKLPVHRFLIEGQSAVYAYKSELDAWYEDRRPGLEAETTLPPRRLTPWLALGALSLALAFCVGFFYFRHSVRSSRLSLSARIKLA